MLIKEEAAASEISTRIKAIQTGHVPDGYKKTKAGIIPADWEIHPLSQHLSESRVPGNNGSVAKKLTVKLWNKGVFEKREVHSGSESTKYYKRKKGQFIYSKLDFLNCAFGIIPDELDGYESTIDLPCFDILGVNNYYLLSYITQPEFYTHYGMLADGGRKARRVDPEEMLSFPLIFPPLPEQQKIAEILSTQDKIIELKEKLLEQKQEQKKSLMQKLFSPDGATFTLCGVKIDKSGWKKEKLGNICDFLDSLRKPVKYNKRNNGIYPYYGASGIIDYVDDYIFDGEYVLLGEDGANIIFRSTPLAFKVSGKMWINNHAHVLKTKDFVNTDFLAYYLESLNYEKYNSGTAQPKLNQDVCEKIGVFLPPLPEQQAIAEVLSTADKEIDLLKAEIEQEKLKKKALMQLLLTGIVRVKV